MGRETKFCHCLSLLFLLISHSRDQQANIKIVNKEINSNLSLKYNIEQTQFLDRKSELKKNNSRNISTPKANKRYFL